MTYKISQLAVLANVTKRTIHFYVAKGLLPHPTGEGVNCLYNETHLNLLNSIKEYQKLYYPLEVIKQMLIKDELLLPIQEDISESDEYVKINLSEIFELHCSKKNKIKYSNILDHIKVYVANMLENNKGE